MAKVLVVGNMHERGLALLRERPDIELQVVGNEFAIDIGNSKAIDDDIASFDAIAVRIAAIDKALIERAERLRVVSRHGVGYDNIDVAALTRRGIPLAIAADANAVSVAEHALYLLLTLAKHGAAYHRAVIDGNFAFRNSLKAIDLWQKRLLIVGFGRVGRRVAARCLAFDMAVAAFDPYIDQAEIEAHGCEPVADLDSALARADAVSLHFPGGGANTRFINAERLRQLKPGALLINTARGDVLDEMALYEQLKGGRLAAAGLDVFATEPLPKDHPLLTLDNVVLSPHSAATTQEGAVRMAIRTIRNVLDGLDGCLDPNMVVNHNVLNGGKT